MDDAKSPLALPCRNQFMGSLVHLKVLRDPYNKIKPFRNDEPYTNAINANFLAQALHLY
jgi:hypothetical protein